MTTPDPTVGSGEMDEMAIALLEANEGLGEAQCRIAVAAGLPRSSPADLIEQRVRELAQAPITALDVSSAQLAWGRMPYTDQREWNLDRGGRTAFIAHHLNQRGQVR